MQTIIQFILHEQRWATLFTQTKGGKPYEIVMYSEQRPDYIILRAMRRLAQKQFNKIRV